MFFSSIHLYISPSARPSARPPIRPWLHNFEIAFYLQKQANTRTRFVFSFYGVFNPELWSERIGHVVVKNVFIYEVQMLNKEQWIRDSWLKKLKLFSPQSF